MERKEKIVLEFRSRNWCWDAVVVGTVILPMEDVDPKNRANSRPDP